MGTTLILLVAAILAYFFIGWLTIWIYYAVSYLVVFITNNDKYFMNHSDNNFVMWAWPIILPLVLLILLFYVPYVTLLKLTPKES